MDDAQTVAVLQELGRCQGDISGLKRWQEAQNGSLQRMSEQLDRMDQRFQRIEAMFVAMENERKQANLVRSQTCPVRDEVLLKVDDCVGSIKIMMLEKVDKQPFTLTWHIIAKGATFVAGLCGFVVMTMSLLRGLGLI